ncbi:MAG: hypothetical protein AAF488_13675, partial [Planctomycetota bacterium]
ACRCARTTLPNGLLVQTVCSTKPPKGSDMRYFQPFFAGVSALVLSLAVVSTAAASTPVTALSCSVDSASGMVLLTWMNSEAYSSIQIDRDGVPLATLPGSATSFNDMPAMLPAMYTVTPACQGVLASSESCLAQSGPTPGSVWFSGYLHSAEGDAIVSPTPNGKLKVSNLGSSGCDGVSISHGDAERVDVVVEELDPTLLPPGSTVTVEPQGMGPSGVASPGLMRFESTVGGELLLSADHSSASVGSYTVTLFDQGQVVFTQSGIAAGDACARTSDGGLIFYEETGTSGVSSVFCCAWSGPSLFHMGDDAASGGGTPVTGDSVRIAPDAPTFIRPTELRVLASTQPGVELTIARTTTHFSAHPVSGTGDAHLETDISTGTAKLRVSNLGSSGCDGVSIANPDPDTSFESMELEADLLADDGGNHEGWIELYSVGQGTMRATEENEEWAISADYSAGGSQTYTLEVWNQGQMVHSESGLSGVGATSAMKIRLFYREYENGELVEKCFISFESASVSTGSGTTVMGDVIMTRPDTPVAGPPVDMVLRGASIVDFDLTAIESELEGPSEPEFQRGDCNADGSKNIGDAITLLDLLFSGGGPVLCDDACDANDDGGVNLGDAVTLLNFLFTGGSIPSPSTCGVDPTADSLECGSYPCP